MIWILALHLVELSARIQIIEVHLITTRTPNYLYIHELTVTAKQLASVAQLVRALHRNRRAVGSIPIPEDLVLHFSQSFLVSS